jgi:polyisoprenoid-binding protein YceI
MEGFMSVIIRNAILFAVVSVVTIAGPTQAADGYHVNSAEVVVVCPLTVGGSFEAKTKSVSGEVAANATEPGNLTGAVRVDLQTLETGIAVRDRHMRETYLEVEKGPEFAVATVDQIRIEKLDGKSKFSGTLLLHGQRQTVTGTAELQQRDGRIRVQAQFPIKVSAFQIPKPTYLGVGVRDEIQIKVVMTVEPTADHIAARQ